MLQIVDTGLGALDKNAANVFSLLEHVTNNSKTINTFANMNASVQVFSSLSQKLNSIDNETAADVSITEYLMIFIECYSLVSNDMEADRMVTLNILMKSNW